MQLASDAPARIGPNAITRVAEALPLRHGPTVTAQVFERAGLARYLRQPPQTMVDEAEVRRLHAALRDTLGDAEARAVARAAGTRTADYLLAHRIPRAAQRLLNALPAALAARVLLAAVARHAWTFAGSGRFSAHCAWAHGPPVVLTIRGNPLCKDLVAPAPACDYYAATFERLFRVLVQPRSQVRESECEACGDTECRFEIDWRRGIEPTLAA